LALTEKISRLLPLCRCGLCGNRIPAGNYSLCTPCLYDLPRISRCCRLCGRPVHRQGVCGNCLNRPLLIDRTVSPYRYVYPVNKLIQRFKYQQQLPAILPLANELAGILCSMDKDLPEVMIPVPLHRRRLYYRGFNQALEICRFLNSRLEIPVDARLVQRNRHTAPMFDLSVSERRDNLRGAFSLAFPLSYRSIAIVDDIITTGTTARELASLLKKAGARQIQLWSLALAG